MTSPFRLLSAAACLAIFTTVLPAQSSSGTITGRVLDSTGHSVPGADITLTKTDTLEERTFSTSVTGDFVFTALQPGPYTLKIQASGFKVAEKTSLNLSSSERLSAGDITLQLGSLTETISVTSQATTVQTASSERSALIDSNQVNNLTTRGRDVFGLLATLPGVVYDGRGADGLGTQAAPASFSGARGVYSVANVDGISGNTRSGAQLDTPVNMDSVAEVKVLSNNYQAEYGKGAAGVVNVVTKGGTREFHGLGYYYMRNEALNANSFFNNAASAPRGPYRYKTIGGNIGGPIIVPGRFNKNRNKLFFFFAQEFLPRTVAQDPRYYTVPTAAERKGDFNQSVGATNGSLYSAAKIVDPLSKNAAGVMQPFPNGIVPASRIDPNMQKLLNVFPLPNAPNVINGGALNPSGTWYNYSLQDSLDRPGQQNSLRVDYNISDKWHAFFRGTNESTHNQGANSTVNRYAWMPDADVDYRLTGPNLGGTLTWIASPTLINEVVFGYGLWTESQVYREAWLAEVQRDKLGVNLPQIYPKQNPLNLIPSLTFGSTNIGPNATTTAWEGRFPMADEADTWTFTDNLTKVWKQHQFKFGLQYEKVHYLFEQSGPNDVFAGKFDFSHNTANTVNNTTYPYANALLGYFNTYTESTNRTQYSPVTPILEFYLQDTWKVSERLTLDLGVRFTAGLQQYQSNNLSSSFVPSMYDPSKAPLLYRPVANNAGARVAIDPRNPGVLLPAALIGQIIPGTGLLKNGIVQAGDPNYPRALVDFQGILPAPRLGFAWDMFGDATTALRGGFGVNYNPRNGSGITGDLQSNPPIVYQPQQLYGNTTTYRDGAGTYTPPAFSDSLNRNNVPARIYNASLGIQRRLGFGTVLDVAYVGTFARHIGQKSSLNNLPYGAHFLTANFDPSQKVPQALGDDFLRQYQGYAAIPFLNFDGNSSYHSLQVSAQRRYAHGFQYGLVYTWSKAMAYTDGDQGNVVTYVSRREFNYGEATYDRTHVFALNYLWAVPGSNVRNPLLKGVVGGWQISGITRFQSGAPLRLSASLKTGCSIAGAPCAATTTNNFGTDITGGGDGWRAHMSGSAVLPKDKRTVNQYFDTSVFSAPALAQQVTDMAGVLRVLALGNTPATFARGPGLNNTDLALFKNFKIREKVNTQLRIEAYNVFNHTQFSGVGTSAQWDQSGAQVTSNFGKVTSALDPRIMQVALRLSF
uniref:TonB-dependent receptor n=1 Tax=Solibacter usitatus (strain Ellin6076) TaxID=234267 RepID=Q01RD7_SOLUE